MSDIEAVDLNELKFATQSWSGKSVACDRDIMLNLIEMAQKYVEYCKQPGLAQFVERALGVEEQLTAATARADTADARAQAAEKRCGELEEALLALKKWDDEYSDLVERSKRWIHDSTLWESNDELAPEWQALWNRYPKSVVDVVTALPAKPGGVKP